MTTTENSRADALTDLLPCPFCGGTDVFVERLDYTACFVQCDSPVNPGEVCGMRGPIGVQDGDDDEMPGRDAAIREWNRRAASPVEQPAAALTTEQIAAVAFAYEFLGECRTESGKQHANVLRAFLDTSHVASAAPSPADERAALLERAEAIVVDAIRRMRAAHVHCQDLLRDAESFMEDKARAASASETGAEGAKPYGWASPGGGHYFTRNETVAKRIGGLIPIYLGPSRSPAMAAEAVAWAAVHFGGERDGKVYATCDTKAEVDQYIARVHQSSDATTLTARPIAFADAAPQPAQADARKGLTDEQREILANAADALETDGGRPLRDEAAKIIRALLQGANHA
ncbi:Lar family restriction alleviation protein [Burkholderia contaminans]|nr:Lar family restriction alleviation protein [Burkholderia contaminans]